MNNTTPEMTAEAAVAAYLSAQGVNFEAGLVGADKRDGWDCDSWRVRFYRTGKHIATDFYTGIGRREPLKRAPKAPENKRSAAYENWAHHWVKPVTPTAANVLHSLLMDAQGAEQSFDYWAADYGYDTDSIKALNIYNACCEIRHQVNTFFTHAEREQLRAMLEDY